MSVTIFIVIGFYSIAFVVQIITMVFCGQLFKQSSPRQWAWLFLSLGLGLMIIQKIYPILYIIETRHYHLTDALLSLPISLLFFASIIIIKRQLAKDETDIDLLNIVNAYDLLTNALSKIEIHRRIIQEFDRAHRNGQCMALLEMDIDYFKRVNDHYGHQAGDDVLIGLVRSTKEILRSIDSLGRIGGEEFLILLPDTNLKQAKEVAERICLNVSNTPYSSLDNQTIKITVSIGITIFDPNFDSYKEKSSFIRQFIYEADMAMYQAKAAGRNQVAIWNGLKKEP